MSRSLVHVLLSLLLLVSQQLSLGHGYTHLRDPGGNAAQQTVRADAADEDDSASRKPGKPGLHDLCAKCAASAPIGFALPPSVRRFVPADLAYATPRFLAAAGVRPQAVSPFQPRAPPRA